jgi:hypothetical protein
MEEKVRKDGDHTQHERSCRGTPKESTAVETPYLVPRETTVGVRYVRARKERRFPGSLDRLSIGVLAVLSAACAGSTTLLAMHGSALAGWRLALGWMYPLQLALDVVGFVRFSWVFFVYGLGELEVELSADRLRNGLRWGALWLRSQTLFLTQIRRLVVAKRPEFQTSFIWELVAECHDDSSMVVVSADDPENVLPLARDLHARLARRNDACAGWPALAEEDRSATAATNRRQRRPLLPGGAWSWLAIHFIGAAGLWQILTLRWFKAPRPPSHLLLLVALVLLQGLIIFVNFGFAQASRETAKSHLDA